MPKKHISPSPRNCRTVVRILTTPTAITAMPTEKYAGVDEADRCEGVSESQDCMEKRTAVQPSILLRVKIYAIV